MKFKGEDNRKEETPELPYFKRTKGGCLVLYYEGEDGKIERVWKSRLG